MWWFGGEINGGGGGGGFRLWVLSLLSSMLCTWFFMCHTISGGLIFLAEYRPHTIKKLKTICIMQHN